MQSTMQNSSVSLWIWGLSKISTQGPDFLTEKLNFRVANFFQKSWMIHTSKEETTRSQMIGVQDTDLTI